MNSTDAGYINRNNQRNLGYIGESKTHYNQRFFRMECLNCGHIYEANGCDVWLRKCPVCQPVSQKSGKRSNARAKATRVISAKLRYQVLKRDCFKCCICGASPAKDSAVELHVDHIVPWSRGGETTMENLQTLCSKCNLGKGNSD